MTTEPSCDCFGCGLDLRGRARLVVQTESAWIRLCRDCEGVYRRDGFEGATLDWVRLGDLKRACRANDRVLREGRVRRRRAWEKFFARKRAGLL